MDKSLVSFKKSYILVVISIIFSLIMKFIDDKFNSKKSCRKDYIKLALLTGFISTVIVYIHNIKGKLDEEVSSGPVPF